MIVGVNRYQEHEQEPIELHRLDPEAERRQLERTERVRAERDAEAAGRALEEVRRVARSDENLLFPMREALRLRCTVGEICEVLREEFGTTTPSGRSADPPRLADVRGPKTPTSACSSRHSRRSRGPRARAGAAVLDSRSGGKARYLRLGRTR